VATSSIDIDVHADEVWAVIAEPTTYPRWLVGTQRILAIDPGFPARGTAFRHEVGVGPFRLRDVSTALECHPRNRRLVLEVRARPVIGSARVEMSVVTAGVGRARVTIKEHPRRILGSVLLAPLAERMIKARNARSLANLRALLEVPTILPETPVAAAVGGVAATAPPARRRRPVRSHRPRVATA
jgi:hypothetical protein